MKFTGGRYKGMEISEVIIKDPDYFLWLLRHNIDMPNDEFSEAHKIFQTTESYKKQPARFKLYKNKLDQVRQDIVGRYFCNGEWYVYVQRFSEKTSKAKQLNVLKDHKFFISYIMSAKKYRTGETISHIGEKYMTLEKLDDYWECSQQDFEDNFYQLISWISPRMGINC